MARGVGHYLRGEDPGEDWRGPKPRAHRINARVNADLYRAIRKEADDSGLTVSTVVRLSLEAGVEAVRDRRTLRELEESLRAG